jgi:hypothetical protein
MRRCLVIANQTLGSSELFEELRNRHDQDGDTTFCLVVPATPAGGGAFWSEGQARAHARHALDDALERLHDAGIDATGDVGDEDPVLAAGDVLSHAPFDEIIVSTFPPGVSRWLHRDLPNRLRRRYALPVTHVAAVPAHAG